MTILVLTQVFPPRPGGSGRWLWELYRRLEGANVHVVAADAAGSAEFDRTAGVPITRIPLDFSSWGVTHARSARQYIATASRLHTIAARIKPDAIHCGKALPEGALAAAMNLFRGIPFLSFAHGEELTLAEATRELTWLMRAVFRRSRQLIANSHHTASILQNAWHVPSTKIHVMHPGVDTTRFMPAAPSAETRRRLGWSDRRVVLTVGALQKRKGQDTFIRALPEIRRRCPDVLYSIAGEGWERAYLEALVADHGVSDAVEFRGVPTEAELLECYQQCDLFALPNRQVGSDFEGFGIVLLEAQACGKPVIAGRSGGTAETMQPARTGELVNAEDPDEVANVSIDLLNDSARRMKMGECARAWMLERFDWQVLVSQAKPLLIR